MNTLVNAYRDAYRRAHEDPEGFWSERAEALHWERRWDRVLDASRAPFYRWFTGGRAQRHRQHRTQCTANSGLHVEIAGHGTYLLSIIRKIPVEGYAMPRGVWAKRASCLSFAP